MSTDRLAGEDATAPEEDPAPPAAADDPGPGAEGAPATPGTDAASAGPGSPDAPGPAGARETGRAAGAEAGSTPADGSGSRQPAAGAAGGGRKRSAAAEALAAAVRAVESGERSAASFFTEQTPPRPGRQGAPASGAGRPGGPSAPAAGAGRPATGPASGAVPPGAGGSVSARPLGPAPAAPRAQRAATLADTAGIREVLAAGGAPEQLAAAVAETLGERAGEMLREDPWLLLSVPGVRPEQADTFARALLGAECGPNDERRTQALVGWLLERAALEGHTALPAATVREALGARSVPDPDEALRAAIAGGGVLVFEDALDGLPGERPAAAAEEDEAPAPVRVLLGLDRYALAEESLADGLARLINTFGRGAAEGPFDDEPAERPGFAGTTATAATAAAAAAAGPTDDAGGTDTVEVAARADTAGPADTAETTETAGSGEPTEQIGSAGSGGPDWAAAANAAPSASAAELIRAAAEHGLVAHSGGEAARAEPVALVTAARALGLRAYAAAHSEDGRRRLAAALGDGQQPADGRLDEARQPGEGHGPGQDDPAAVTVAGLLSGHEGPGRDAEGALALDLLAVLDAPQLDVETAAMLVESLPDGARLVLSGDPGVLWSAGPGRVFADVLAARCCPQIVSRTPDPGPIGELVSGIGIGELDQVEAPGKEVVIVPVRDAGEAVHRTVQLVADSVPRVIGVPAEAVQVITPGHGGAAGTRALNAALKERLNPGPGRFGGFDPGDRVAYVPAPGRTVPGTVVSADAEGLRLDCAGTPLVVPRESVADTVRHGWALTAHQAAGLRWPAAVVVLPGDATAGLTRSWVYTAFGRGERHLSVVHGAQEALPRAVAEVPAKERTTRLRTLLEAQRPPAG